MSVARPARGSAAVRRAGVHAAALLLMWTLQPAACAVAGAHDGAPADADAWLIRLVERTVASGQDAKISPHLTVLLGLSTHERDTPVRQLGVKSGENFWLFNVCADDYSRLVLMRVESGRHVQVFRMSARGKWLRGVAYEIGGATQLLTRAQSAAEFQAQRQFWKQREIAVEGGG